MTEGEETGVSVLPQVEPGVLSQIVGAEVNVQVSTAKAYLRDVQKAREEMENLACISKETAESCFYAYKRAGKLIEGPSIRVAEIALSSWGNISAEARVVEESRREVTAQATVWDMEKNVPVRIECKRRIVDKNGNRFSTDMILVTSNAAISIALRNATFRVIPRAIIDEIYQKARKVAFGDAKAIIHSRGVALETFAKLGVDEDRLLAVLAIESTEDIGAVELSKLRGILNAIRDGDTKIEEAFPPVPAEGAKPDAPAPASRTASVMDKLREQEGASAPPAATEPGKESETSEAPAAPPPPAETAPAEAPEQTELPQKPETTKKKPSGPKKERLIAIEQMAADAGIPTEDLAQWKEEIDIRDGQLRSQSSKRLGALQGRVDAWIGAHPDAEPTEPAEPEPVPEKRVVVGVGEKIVAGLLDRIHGLIGWEGDEARQWAERVLELQPGEIPSMAEITAEQAGRLEVILDKREESLAEGSS